MDYKGDLVDSVVTAGAFWGVDKYFYNDSEGCLKRSLVCGGCDFAAAASQDMLQKWIVGMHPTVSYNLLQSTLKPVTTGALYLGANKLMPMDNKSTLIRFLEATGASYLGTVATPYVKKTLNL